jgi:hypothetical protein
MNTKKVIINGKIKKESSLRKEDKYIKKIEKNLSKIESKDDKGKKIIRNKSKYKYIKRTYFSKSRFNKYKI